MHLKVNGLWLCAEFGGGVDGLTPPDSPVYVPALVANRPSAGIWESFTLHRRTDWDGEGTAYSIQCYNGQFVCAEGGGVGPISTNRPHQGGWERFITTPEGKLQCWDGSFLGLTADREIRAGYRFEDAAIFEGLPVPLPVGELPDLEVKGRHFYDRASGARVVIASVDQFWAYLRWRRGEDLSALVEESHDLGAFYWRVFLQLSWFDSGPEVLPLDRFADFVDWANREGIGIKAVVLADCRQLGQDLQARIARWRQVCEMAQGRHCLVTMGNEAPKNGYDPLELPVPSEPILWSRGSGLSDEAPPKPEGSFSEFHPRRDLHKMLDDTVASVTNLYMVQGFKAPLCIDEPLGFHEVPTSNRSNDPMLARELASLYAVPGEHVGWSELCFHSTAGTTSSPMGPITRQCAEAWFDALYRVSGMED